MYFSLIGNLLILTMQKHTLTVEHEGYRIDRYCSVFFPQVSSLKRAKKWMRKGWVTLNGQRVESSRFVEVGDCIELTLPNEVIPVWEFPIDVLWEDEFMAVVYKPAGMPVHSNDGKSLRNTLGFVLQRTSEPDALIQFEPVHRLDARTQGLMLIAKTARARARLGEAFAERGQIHKWYQCLAVGSVNNGESTELLDGKPAHTRWRVVETCPSVFTGTVSLLEVQIFTGRTHQIRKHLQMVGHPVLGDDMYHNGRPLKHKGLFLCAVRLSFVHPLSGLQIEVSVSTPSKLRKRWAFEANRIKLREQRLQEEG